MDLIWRSEKIIKFGDFCHFAPIAPNFLRAKIYPNKGEKLAYFLRKMQTSRVNNSSILRIKNAKFSGYYFYIHPNI